MLSFSTTYGGTADDTLYVSGNAVVFFGPTQPEYDSLNENRQAEMNEVISDFYHYHSEVTPFLERNGIKDFITAKALITIQLTGTEIRSFRRQNFKHAMGMIMSDGKREPKVYLGVATDFDLIEMFKDFFIID